MTLPESSSLSSDRLALLCRLSQEFNTSLDPDLVLERVMDEVITATQAERGFLVLLEEAGEGGDLLPNDKRLTVKIARGLDRQTIDSPDFKVSRSIIEQVARTGQPVLTSDAQSDQRFQHKESVIAFHLRSILCSPLLVKGSQIGVIYVDNRIQASIFRPEDLVLLNAIAANAAIALENARLYLEAQLQVQSLQLLHKISSDLTSNLDLQQVLTISIRGVQELVEATAASILTLEGDELVFQVALGEKADSIKPFRIPKDKGLAGWVVQHMEPVIVNDAQHDSRFYTVTDRQTGFLTLNLAAVPLIIGERAIGVIEVFNRPEGFKQDDLDLLMTFASTAAIAIENARLYQVAIEIGRMEHELQMARRVQNTLIPRETPHIPGWDFSTCWLPAREVGGDYIDFVPLEANPYASGQVGFVIGDVTDKGMPAALFMTLTRSTLRASLSVAVSPVEGIHHANRLVCADSPDSMFVTLFYGQFDPATGSLTYVNAGHMPPYWVRANAKPGLAQVSSLTRTGIPIGIEPDLPYEQGQVRLETGDFVVCYTDGVTDAVNGDNESFGMDRLEKLVASHASDSAAEMVDAIQHAVRDFTGDQIPFDDFTLLVIKRL